VHTLNIGAANEADTRLVPVFAAAIIALIALDPPRLLPRWQMPVVERVTRHLHARTRPTEDPLRHEFPMLTPSECLASIESLDLSPEVRSLFTVDNARRAFKSAT